MSIYQTLVTIEMEVIVYLSSVSSLVMFWENIIPSYI